MYGNPVVIGIGHHCRPAVGAFERLEYELHAARPKLLGGRFEIVDLQGGRYDGGTQRSLIADTRDDRNAGGSDVIFDSLVLAFVLPETA